MQVILSPICSTKLVCPLSRGPRSFHDPRLQTQIVLGLTSSGAWSLTEGHCPQGRRSKQVCMPHAATRDPCEEGPPANVAVQARRRTGALRRRQLATANPPQRAFSSSIERKTSATASTPLLRGRWQGRTSKGLVAWADTCFFMKVQLDLCAAFKVQLDQGVHLSLSLCL